MLNCLHIHIGDHKTGTTSIQDCCSQNRDTLTLMGLIYPDNGAISSSGHHQIPRWFSKKRSNLLDNQFKFDQVSANWLKKYNSSNLLLSSENFRFLPRKDIFNLKEMLPAKSYRIIIYLREPISRFLSGYKQHVKSYATRCNSSLTTFMSDNKYAEVVDYGKIIKRWKSVFGADNVTVRCFESTKGNLLSDFFQIVDIDISKLQIQKVASNVGLDDLSTAAMAVLNLTDRPPQEHRNLLAAMAQTSTPQDRQFSLLAGQHLQSITDYLYSNKIDFEEQLQMNWSRNCSHGDGSIIDVQTVFDRIHRMQELQTG